MKAFKEEITSGVASNSAMQYNVLHEVKMSASTTTSIRLPDELLARLVRAEKMLCHGKNWILKQALESFLEKLEKEDLKSEANRQALLANKTKFDDEAWFKAGDHEDWNE